MDMQGELGYALVTADVMDAVQIGMCAVMDTLKDPAMSGKSMENMFAVQGCFLAIRKAMYIQSDFANYSSNFGYYNVNDFMTKVCENLSGYLSGLFDVEIKYERNPDVYHNVCFDGRLVEKAMYDIAYNMMGYESRGKCITFYVKSSLRYVEFGARTNFPLKGVKRNFAEIEVMYPSVATILEGETYASVAAKQMGGYAKNKYLKNMTRMEIGIPRTLMVSESCMRESKTVISNGERVMVYEVCSRATLRDFFAGIEYKTDKRKGG